MGTWNCATLWKIFGSWLKVLTIYLPYDPDFLFLGNYPRKWKYINIKTYMWILLVAIFIIAPNEKQPNLAISNLEWIQWIMVYEQFHSSIKRNELLVMHSICEAQKHYDERKRA